MARGLNKVMLIGNIGRDPEIRHTASGKTVANLSVATSDTWKDKQSGETIERTEWHRCIVWGRLAEIIGQYCRKGAKVYLEGSLQTKEWEQDGIKRYTTEINVRDMQMLDTKGTNLGAVEQKAHSKMDGAQQANAYASATSGKNLDEDIPF